MVNVDYSHDVNRELHTLEGAVTALAVLFPGEFPKSVLDVGCGRGTWLHAALKRGATDVLGVDGIQVRSELLLVPRELIRQFDLNQQVHLGRKFDLVISVETAEHIEPENAAIFVETLTGHGNSILFSAAAPGQGGTHHVNCRWPDYWQALFNERGFVCYEHDRWKIWQNQAIEPWYRQNLISAQYDPSKAGFEPRIQPVIHPDLLPSYSNVFFRENVAIIEAGGLPWKWYVSAPYKALATKARQRLFRTA